ncbi:hypothetical protein A33M_0517 [Rhodovulum sp. PH10]|uniref:ShlB/FhaC/HecB family hemolysin secretion/activation protein n=1 Tax=Rhodovulum sp. PH10 TaxID=1187851 RepID=UPI00027C2ABC|nr:ShlB/FhaC/HecB family hemolysin secretion/activation protein [Rhodovulum sp. PH10]EJW10095.1 hypothetical protein A33M_0517 [Rhodovulum sp. PH10]
MQGSSEETFSKRSRRRAGRPGFAVAAVLAAMLVAAPARAQYVERNLPPAPARPAPAITLLTPDLLKSDDDTPLGTDLLGIVLIGAKDTPLAAPKKRGVDLSGIPAIDPARLKARLAGFLGKPLSRKLVLEVQAAVVGIYRDAGRAFVSVTVPPQEITGGTLQLRVFEYRAGRITVSGAERTGAAHIRERIRITPGAPIDSQTLETDLDWLNRNPFRRVEAVFGPGKDLAETDLTLRTTEQKPWQVYAGYANTGTLYTGRDRWFTGASAALPGDVLASYQATGSREFWVDDGELFGDTEDARYQSHAGRLIVPLWPRASLEVIASWVQTNEAPVAFLSYRTRTAELSLLHRSALSNILPGTFGDLLLGVETKRQNRAAFFTGFGEVADASADVFQAVVGFAGRFSDRFGTSDLNVRLKVNPGEMLPENSAAAWAMYSGGRVTDIDYALATLAYVHTAPLPENFVLTNELFALIAGTPLPDPERVSLGGAFQVRGYMTEDRTVDQAVIVRNTLYFPAVSLGERLKAAWLKDALTPYVFGDVGWGRDLFLDDDITLASIGAGLDQRIGTAWRANVGVGLALLDGPHTPAGSWRIDARVTASY